jgi:hypothetical protein
MFNPPKFLTTLFLGAVSGLGFYSVSSPATRLGTFAMHYLLPSPEKSESTVHKTDRRDVANTFKDRWPHFSAAQSASADTGHLQIAGSNKLLSSFVRLVRQLSTARLQHAQSR